MLDSAPQFEVFPRDLQLRRVDPSRSMPRSVSPNDPLTQMLDQIHLDLLPPVNFRPI